LEGGEGGGSVPAHDQRIGRTVGAVELAPLKSATRSIAEVPHGSALEGCRDIGHALPAQLRDSAHGGHLAHHPGFEPRERKVARLLLGQRNRKPVGLGVPTPRYPLQLPTTPR
jgi:hypothetical protein